MPDFERQWQNHHDRGGQALSDSLKVMILMQLLPAKEQAEMRLRYVNTVMTSTTLKGHIENWVKHLPKNAKPAGDDPMDVGAVDDDSDNEQQRQPRVGERDADLETRLEKALDALREARAKKGKSKGKGKKKGDRKGARDMKGKKIKGKCWNCDKDGHCAADCPEPKRKAAGALDTDDEDSDDGLSTGSLCLATFDIEDGGETSDESESEEEEEEDHGEDEERLAIIAMLEERHNQKQAIAIEQATVAKTYTAKDNDRVAKDPWEDGDPR